MKNIEAKPAPISSAGPLCGQCQDRYAGWGFVGDGDACVMWDIFAVQLICASLQTYRKICYDAIILWVWELLAVGP